MKQTYPQLKLGLLEGPSQEDVVQLLKRAGFEIEILERGYFTEIQDNIFCILLKPQEIPKYVQIGKLDLGITNDEYILEAKADVVELPNFQYPPEPQDKIKLVLAVPEDSKIKTIKDLEGKVISTEIVNLVGDYLKKKNVKAKVEFSWGRTPFILADAIVGTMDSPEFLKLKHLRVLDVVLESSIKLISNKISFENARKREEIERLALLLAGAARAVQAVNLMMRVSEERLESVLEILPRLKFPSIKKIIGEPEYSILVNCKAQRARELIPMLKRLGCEGIVQYPTTKLIP